MKWKIKLNDTMIGEADHVTLTVGMPQWCKGVCYLVESLDYKKRIVTVKEHPANAGK